MKKIQNIYKIFIIIFKKWNKSLFKFYLNFVFINSKDDYKLKEILLYFFQQYDTKWNKQIK